MTQRARGEAAQVRREHEQIDGSLLGQSEELAWHGDPGANHGLRRHPHPRGELVSLAEHVLGHLGALRGDVEPNPVLEEWGPPPTGLARGGHDVRDQNLRPVARAMLKFTKPRGRWFTRAAGVLA